LFFAAAGAASAAGGDGAAQKAEQARLLEITVRLHRDDDAGEGYADDNDKRLGGLVAKFRRLFGREQAAPRAELALPSEPATPAPQPADAGREHEESQA
jgi:hypothetical protein